MKAPFVMGMVIVACLASAIAAAPGQGASRPTRSERTATGAAGPSMSEIEAWTQRELPPLGADVYVQTGGKSSFTYKYAIDKATLTQCRLIINATSQMTYTTWSSDGARPSVNPPESHVATVFLRHADPDGLAASAAPPPTGVWTENKPKVSVVFRALPNVDEPFTTESAKVNERTDEVSVHIKDMESASSVVEILKRAATLCAATPPPPPPSAEMTNAVVTKLVAAGLSDQVITTSIRSATSREFNLQPAALIALKKANVSDALIAVMQESGNLSTNGKTFTSAKVRKAAAAAAQQARVASAVGKFYRHGKPSDYVELFAEGMFQLHEGRKLRAGTYKVVGTTIRFTGDGPCGEVLCSPEGRTSRLLAPGDSTLRDKVKVTSATIDDVNSGTYWEKEPTITAPPPPADIGCAGVEMMGLYKNEIFDRAMGGGVVEWLAKIRNNTGATRIVAFGWRDMYGQQQRSQAQIRGGDIASLRVDMTQARAIAPVTDLRLLSCE